MDECAACADGILDSLRQLLNALACLVPGPVGQNVATDATDARSLPALSKALKRLWFETNLEAEDWCEERQAIWLSQLLLILAGSREAILSFYAAGLLLCNSLQCFARVLYPHVGMELDEPWLQNLLAVQTAVERDFQQELQYLPADHLGGSKRDAIVSTNRLPALFRRMFDLEGHKLTPAQKGGLAVALVLPGTGLLTAGGLGAALLLRKARQARSEDDPLERLFSRCLEEARGILVRKNSPVEVTYLPGSSGGPSKVKVCVQARESMVPSVPLGSLGNHGVNVAVLQLGQSCKLRPRGSEVLVLRAFRPSLINEPLMEAVELRRGAKVLLVPHENQLKCYVRKEAASRNLEATQPAESNGTGASDVQGCC
ncbi:unnamed protein product [Effrenium voratum]|uniref:Uncharacterized protein n=1 Tax=Effrenium voratum TaxID=2562239 RepID=A0AA36MT76_9DINO|nr:unnamed protein product [Effrenium voratum]